MTKRIAKENQIIDAAEKVFSSQGFVNAKMEDVAKAAGISKGSVYFYFSSKENLYMTITYRAFQLLIDTYYSNVEKTQHDTGLASTLNIMEVFMRFCENHFLYSEAMLIYISMVRSSSEGADISKMTEAIQDSIYYKKVQDLQHIPVSIVIKEIERGKLDGSIKNTQRPEIIYLTAWAMVIGYIKLNTSSGKKKPSILKTEISEWRSSILTWAKMMLINESEGARERECGS